MLPQERYVAPNAQETLMDFLELIDPISAEREKKKRRYIFRKGSQVLKQKAGDKSIDEIPEATVRSRWLQN